MVNFWSIVDSVLTEADVILLVVDARMVEQTLNKEIVHKVDSMGKTLITVINKADLVEKDLLEPYKQKFHPCVFVSAQKFYGMTMLRHMVLRYATDFPVTVGVVGYPNTGKSSIINALKGKASAGVSPISGYTKGRQNIKVDNKMRVIDTPGVLSDTDDKTSLKLKVTASINTDQDPDLVVYELLKRHAKQILKHYEIFATGLDEEEMLEHIALKLNRVQKGGKPDTQTTAKIIIQDWNKGRILV